MIEGLWIVQYVGLQGSGGGAIVLINGKVLGGDTGYLYIGTYAVEENTFSARVKVTNFLPDIPNVLGIQGDFELDFQVPISLPVMQGAMGLVGRPGAGIAVKMTKAAEL
jgi:T3SS negative regulator,GrlR